MTNSSIGKIKDAFLSFFKSEHIWNSCSLLLVSDKQYESTKQQFKTQRIERIASQHDLRHGLERLSGKRFTAIGITCPSVTRMLEEDILLMDELRRICSDKLFVAFETDSDPSAGNLRRSLHSVGFYEIAEISPNQISSYLNSSVSGLADGGFELLSLQPYLVDTPASKFLVASRLSLTTNSHNYWILHSKSLVKALGDGITASDDPGVGLATKSIHNQELSVGSTVTIEANISWGLKSSDHSFAGLVGSYNGPGDSNMYVAMVDCYNSVFAQLSLWRSDPNWERIAYTHFPLKAQTPLQSLTLQLTIAPSTIEVKVDNSRLLWAYDERLERTCHYGIRMRGCQFYLSPPKASIE